MDRGDSAAIRWAKAMMARHFYLDGEIGRGLAEIAAVPAASPGMSKEGDRRRSVDGKEWTMRKFLLIIAFFALGLGGARAQTDAKSPDALAQMQLTEPQIQQYLEAQPDMDALMNDTPQTQDADTPDPKFIAKLEEIAKKHKFSNYGEFDAVAGNIALVLEGVDEKTKKFIGPEAELKKQIAELQANKNISADDKKAELAELNGELKSIVPIKFKANIDLVLKYYDKLAGDEPQKP